MHLHPEFIRRMEEELGSDAAAFFSTYNEESWIGLRENTRRGYVSGFERVPWCPSGVYVPAGVRMGKDPLHAAGAYYMQEPSAMAPVEALGVEPGMRVLDLCAAPGGKSTQIADKLCGKGILVTNEIHPARARILLENIERMGVTNAVVLNETPARIAKHFGAWFDAVLVDAPCSGEGMFRKEEAAVTDWSQETVEMCARRQAEILHSGALLVRPGGRLVYSTCTFAPEENELAIANFLAEHPDFTPETVDAPWFTPGPDGSFRMWPHKLLGEGHFGAVLRKAGEEFSEEDRPAAQKLPKEWTEFEKKLDICLPEGYPVMFGQSLYWAPAGMPEIRGVKVLRPGLELGEVKKGRFEPAHALALWLKTAANVQDLSADGEQIKAYMHGETISCDRSGWCLVTVGGYSIGWGKGDGNVLKNHYPKGLRR